MSRLIPIFSLLLLVAPSLPLQAAAEWPASGIVIALKPDKNPDAMLREREELAKLMQKALGCPVKVIVPLSASVIREGLHNGSIDVAYVSATEFVTIETEGAAKLLLANEIDGKTSYDSLWIVRKNAPYSDIGALRGKPVAFSSRTSTSGFLIPLKDLKERGFVKTSDDLESFFGAGNVQFGTGYVSAVERVLSGQAEAAAVSDYVFEGGRHLTPEQKGQLRVLQRQGPVPTHVLAVSRRLNGEQTESLRAAFLGMESDEAARALRDEIFTARFVEVDPAAHTESVRAALQLVTGK